MKEELDFEAVKEPWAEYQLEDGTVFQLKPVLIKIVRTENIHPDGSPVFETLVQCVGRVRNKKTSEAKA